MKPIHIELSPLGIFLILALAGPALSSTAGNPVVNTQEIYASAQVSGPSVSESVQLSDSFSAQQKILPTVDPNPVSFSTTSNSITMPYNVTSGTNKLLLVGVSINGSSGISSLTVSTSSDCQGGTALTNVTGAASNSGAARTEIFYMVASAAGQIYLCSTLDSSPYNAVYGIASLNNVNQTNPIVHFGSAAGQATSPNITLSSSVGNIVIDTVVNTHSHTVITGAITPGSLQTSLWLNSTTSLIGFGSSTPSQSGFTSMTWSPSLTSWSDSAVEIQGITVTYQNTSVSPSIVDVIASDPLNRGVPYQNGDTITLLFSHPTNVPFGNNMTKSQLDSLFTFSQSLGLNYSGVWRDNSTLVITVLDSTGATPPQPGTFTVLVNPNTIFFNIEGTASVLKGVQSPTMVGSFAAFPPPIISSIVANDPHSTGKSGYHNGNTITVIFSEPTNQPPVATKANIDSLFSFSQNLGNDYSGTWLTSSTLIITINDATGATPPTIGGLTLTVKASGNLKNAAETSIASTVTSTTLSGSFSNFQFQETVAPHAGILVALPSGITVTIQAPNAGTITVTNTTTSNVIGSSTVKFIGNVIDIAPSANTCSPSCVIQFAFTDADLANAGISLSDVKILHDVDNDGDYDQSNEILATTVSSSTTGKYIAMATVPSFSKFAIGGISSLAIFGASENTIHASPPSVDSATMASSTPAQNGELGGILSLGSGQTQTFKTGDPIQVKVELSDYLGASFIQHIGFHTNFVDQSDQNGQTYIMYEPGKPFAVFDPTHFLSYANVSTSQNGMALDVVFTMKFAKPMQTSGVIIRSWDQNLVSSNKVYPSALSVISSSANNLTSNTPLVTQNTQTNLQAQQSLQIPYWIKNNAQWWSDGKIGDSDFEKGIQYMIQQGIMKIPSTQSGQLSSNSIPNWVKNNAKWWSANQIGDEDFVKGIQYLITSGIIRTGS